MKVKTGFSMRRNGIPGNGPPELGLMGRWANLATHHPVRCGGCRILEQKQTKQTKRESRFRIGTSFPSFASVNSKPIVPNRAQSCYFMSPNPVPVKKPTECWSAGVLGRWLKSATHHSITPPLQSQPAIPQRRDLFCCFLRRAGLQCESEVEEMSFQRTLLWNFANWNLCLEH
jgi:hypothetical protein